MWVWHLEGDAANRQVLVVLQHAQIFGHQGGSVDQAHGRLGVAFSDVVLLSHVLQPRQPEVRRGLVALGDSERGNQERSQRCCFPPPETRFLFIISLI